MKVFIVIAASFLLACKANQVFYTVPASDNEPSQADAVIRQFEARAFEGSDLKWTLTGTEAFVFNESDITVINMANAQSYSKGQKSTTMSSNNLKINNATEEMKASGSVVIQAVNGRRINAESILYEGKTKVFSSQEAVKITYAEGDVINGIGFRADSELNKVEIFQVTGMTSQ